MEYLSLILPIILVIRILITQYSYNCPKLDIIIYNKYKFIIIIITIIIKFIINNYNNYKFIINFLKIIKEIYVKFYLKKIFQTYLVNKYKNILNKIKYSVNYNYYRYKSSIKNIY